MGEVYVVGNFKGGVGKTKTVTMLAYESSQVKKRKTLVLDLDPQGNATSILAKTGNIDEITVTITDGFEQEDLKNSITPIAENLDLIASNTAFRNLPKLLMSKFPNNDENQINYLNFLLKDLKGEYDSIYIDVPPTISDYSDNAMMAADYCIIVLQTQELSLDGAQTYIAYMQYLSDTYNNNLQVLGIIPCMLRKGGRVDKKVLDQAREIYGGNVIETVVNYQERLKVYDVEGIRIGQSYKGKPDSWDLKAHKLFIDVLDELDEHQVYFESMEETV
jgi:ATPases involved in chromosome partitioning